MLKEINGFGELCGIWGRGVLLSLNFKFGRRLWVGFIWGRI